MKASIPRMPPFRSCDYLICLVVDCCSIRMFSYSFCWRISESKLRLTVRICSANSFLPNAKDETARITVLGRMAISLPLVGATACQPLKNRAWSGRAFSCLVLKQSTSHRHITCSRDSITSLGDLSVEFCRIYVCAVWSSSVCYLAAQQMLWWWRGPQADGSLLFLDRSAA